LHKIRRSWRKNDLNTWIRIFLDHLSFFIWLWLS
jgi:hypothetical protein